MEFWYRNALARNEVTYASGSQPVARGPKVARQALKSGPRPQK